MRVLVAGLLVAAFSGAVTGAQTPAAPGERSGERWWSHVEFLASDAMKGRNTGSDELKAAAEYIARQFADAGLAPAAVDGFFQPVAFRTRRIIEAESSLALVRDGKVEPLVARTRRHLQHAHRSGAIRGGARLVFAGYGLVVPEAGYDDLAGLDVKGAVVVHLSGSPPDVPGPLAAHFSSAAAALGRAPSAPAPSASSTSPIRRAPTCRGSGARPTVSPRRWRSPTRCSMRRPVSSCR